MGRTNDIGNYRFFEYYAIFLTLFQVTAVSIFVDEDLYSFVVRLGILIFIPFFVPHLKKDLNLVGLLYCGAITLGFIFHRIQGLDAKLFGEALIRIVPVLIIFHYKDSCNYPNKSIRLFALSFYVLECVLAIYERLMLDHLLDYSSDSQAMNANMYLDEDFRSFSLMGHPLHNANSVSVVLAFILCSKTIKPVSKLFLVFLGLGAIWAFNSRACMVMWLAILFYRFFLYGKSFKWMLTSIGILLIVFPSFFLYVQNTGIMGRLDFDFSDGSTLTRLMAIETFLSHPWSLSEMLFGGTLLDMPTFGTAAGVADYVYIENGYLLDLGYWGFVLGPIKILGEMIISYQALHFFKRKDKVIIMIALWGVAVMNNNTFFKFLMPFFMCSYLAFGINQPKVAMKPK